MKMLSQTADFLFDPGYALFHSHISFFVSPQVNII